ncbi:ankyrin repeat domain-containing protein [bacterium]|nr:ankyrin repeat domain-containing protein [bacterium]
MLLNRYGAAAVLLTLGADANRVDRRSGQPPLHTTVSGHDRAPMVRLLLRHHARPNERDERGETAIDLALLAGFPDPIRALLEGGADPNATNAAGETALHVAARGRPEWLDILVQRGAQVDQADLAGQTPLMAAAGAGSADAVTALLSCRANPNAKNSNGQTPLMLASQPQEGSAAVAALLKGGAKVKTRDGAGKTALHYAAAGASKETLTLLCDAGADLSAKDAAGMEPCGAAEEAGNETNQRFLIARLRACRTIFQAVREGDLRLVQQRLDEGVDPNKRDAKGSTPLSYALWRPEIAALLIKRGARPSSLHEAAAAGNLAAVRHLVARGASVNEALDEHYPLYYAASSGDLDSVKYLVGQGAKINAVNGSACDEANALDAAGAHFPVLKWLLDHGAKAGPFGYPLIGAVRRRDEAAVRYLVAHGANVNMHQDISGDTPLKAAASGGNLRMCRLLVSLGAKINDIDPHSGRDEDPVLSYAVANLAVLKWLVEHGANANPKGGAPLFAAVSGSRDSAVRYLVAHGAKLNQHKDFGYSSEVSDDTPLKVAVDKGDLQMCKLLLDLGADVNYAPNGETALWWAQRDGYDDIASLLRKQGAK